MYTCSYTMVEMLALEIIRSDTEAVYEQIARRLRELIGAGQLRPGNRLPPVRSLASDLGVNLNTVARAYRLLEQDGFVSIERRGVRVLSPPERAAPADATRLQAELRDLLRRMWQVGVERAALAGQVEQVLDELERARRGES